MTAPRISVETWDPEYGSPLGRTGLEPSDVSVGTDVELPADRWAPIAPAAHVRPPSSVLFIDGVRRIDAMIWIATDAATPRQGICASYAAGTVRAAERATIDRAEVRRTVFSSVPLDPLITSVGTFDSIVTADDDPEQLSLALQRRLGELEIVVGTSLTSDAELIVVDGPLSGRQNVPGAVGYVKTHRVSYLPAPLDEIVGRLEPGERTPLFVSTTSWTRYSWYLRLPGPRSHPWSGIVRLEASGELTIDAARRLADITAATLPRYASVPHKDPRAPQNLFPIGGLEHELRHRLGDAAIVHRALRSATAR